MTDKVTRRGNTTRNSNEHKRLTGQIRHGEKPLNRAERRAQQKGKKTP